MKELIKQMEALPIIVKVILALFVDIVWSIYRIVKGVDENNTTAIILSIILLFVPLMWIFDTVMILLKGNVWTYA